MPSVSLDLNFSPGMTLFVGMPLSIYLCLFISLTYYHTFHIFISPFVMDYTMHWRLNHELLLTARLSCFPLLSNIPASQH